MSFGAPEPVGIPRMIEVNAIGPRLVTQAFADLLEAAAIEDKPSRVVHISSWLGSIATKTSGGNYGYYASEATQNIFTRAMAFDLLPRGVVSVVVNPGWVQTDMGCARARLTPEASVAGVVAVADGLTPADAGRFLQWDGAALDW